MYNQHKTPELAEQAALADVQQLFAGYQHIIHAGSADIRWSQSGGAYVYQYLWYAPRAAIGGLESLGLQPMAKGADPLEAMIYGLPYAVQVLDPQHGIPALQAAVSQASNRHQVEATRLGDTVSLLTPRTRPAVSPTGTQCSACGEPQFDTPHGPCCQNGHGGAAPK